MKGCILKLCLSLLSALADAADLLEALLSSNDSTIQMPTHSTNTVYLPQTGPESVLQMRSTAHTALSDFVVQ